MLCVIPSAGALRRVPIPRLIEKKRYHAPIFVIRVGEEKGKGVWKADIESRRIFITMYFAHYRAWHLVEMKERYPKWCTR